VSAGIDPATERLAVLLDVLTDFEEAYGQFDDAVAEDRLRDSPEQIAESGAQGGVTRWLSRRPR
jgi:hypothetical protein